MTRAFPCENGLLQLVYFELRYTKHCLTMRPHRPCCFLCRLIEEARNMSRMRMLDAHQLKTDECLRDLVREGTGSWWWRRRRWFLIWRGDRRWRGGRAGDLTGWNIQNRWGWGNGKEGRKCIHEKERDLDEFRHFPGYFDYPEANGGNFGGDQETEEVRQENDQEEESLW